MQNAKCKMQNVKWTFHSSGCAPHFAFCILHFAFCISLFAAEPAAQKPAAEKPAPDKVASTGELVTQQEAVAAKFDRLEKWLLEMAELSMAVDPERADLLRKAIAQSKDRAILTRLEESARLLKKEQLADAAETQAAADRELRALVDLLFSADRSRRLDSQKARIRQYLKQISAILNQQRDVQGRTGRDDNPKQLAEEQGKLATKTDNLAQDIKAKEEGPDKPPSEAGKQPVGKKADAPPMDQPPAGKQGAGKQGAGKQGAGKQGAGKDGKGKEGTGKQGTGKEGTAKEGKGKEAKGGADGQSKSPAQGKGEAKKQTPGQGQGQGQDQGQDDNQNPDQNQNQPPNPQENPARKRLEAARERMREAEQKLRDAQRQGATEKQDEAIRELQQAKAALEEILRQLREEEMQRVLASLEARFTKMLEMQRAVLEGTVELDNIPRPSWTRLEQNKAGQLSGKEGEIDIEAEKALTLLREEGSAVAFPEAVGQMRDDIQQAGLRLSQAKVDKLTQDVEQDVIASLEEMLKALKKALKDLEKQRQQQPNSPPGQPQDPPLVDALAEIKMIRSLQVWVNNRTERYTHEIKGEQAESPDVIEAVRRLGERQQRIYKITRDLEMGKNR